MLVLPHYETWFIAARPKSDFISDWKDLYLQMSTKTYDSAQAYLKPLTTWLPWFYLHETVIEAWTCRMTIALKQLRLNDAEEEGQLAVRWYGITGIDASQSALVV